MKTPVSHLLRAAALTAVLGGTALFVHAANEVTGAGASFPAPLYGKWADSYHKATGVKVNYQSIGSGAGIKQITARTVDFGATDMPLRPEVLARDGLVQFPTVIGGVVPVVNVQGVAPGQMRLTGPVLADIYLAKITKWNDKAIADLNPGLSLPNADIAVVRRADGSGTTFLFTNYLSKVSEEWRTRVGEGTAVQWPTGLGGKGNEGVSAFLQRIPNSIGYVEYIYAKQNKQSHTLLRNAAGNFVAPDDTSFKAASADADWGRAAFGEILTNQAGKDAWPITGATFILMHRLQDKPAQGAAALRFFEWAYQNGDRTAQELEYVPLPDSLVRKIQASWADIKDGAGRPVFSGK